MNTLPKGVHIPLQVLHEGEPVLLDTADDLRRVRSYFDVWIDLYDIAGKLPQLTPRPSALDTNEPSAASPTPEHTIDYIVLALQAHGGTLSLEALYEQVRALGWSTTSANVKLALRNLENTARNHKDRVTFHKGTVRLVKSD